MRFGSLVFLVLSLVVPASGRRIDPQCGTTQETPRETMFHHRQAVRARAARPRPQAVSGNRDIGNLAIIEDSDGVVARQNQFNLDLKTLQFLPSTGNATHYRYAVIDGGYDAGAATSGTPLAALDDDDSRLISIPFSFPFFGATYKQVFVNSDGNLTFTAADNASTDRSLGRMTAGPPRISPLFDDLNPSQTVGGVRVSGDSTRLVVSWVSVPEFGDGLPARMTFQARLYPDGRIEFAYAGVNPTSAVVGIAPGNIKGTTSLVDFRNDPSGDYSAAIAERFGNSLQIDLVTTAQKFYQTHEDAYDYLVIYNNEDIPALGEGVVAFESTVRNLNGSGYAVETGDVGAEYGSASRLQAVLNLGQLSQYPNDPTLLVPARAPQGDTPITIIAHETGHLFLAFASIADPNDPNARPMLGYQGAHWNFGFNSEASLLEGERIVDRGPNVTPRFQTTDTAQQYAPLDQYLMGFRAPADVPDTFLVTGLPAFLNQAHPLRNFAFDGVRQNIGVDQVIQAMGRRTPDSTVAQRRFRFAFILVVAQGSDPSAATLAKVDTFRQQFETFYAKAAGGNALADTSLKRSLKLSVYPSAGVVVGASTTATLTVQTAPASDLSVALQAPNNNAGVPVSVRIPAGATSASFAITGLRTGVEEVTAVPADSGYETAAARVQVADQAALRLVAISGDRQVSTTSAPLPDPVVVSLTDANRLVYAGARITATASSGGSVSPLVAVTDSSGQASFRWTPGSAGSNELRLAVEAAPAVVLTITAGTSVPVVSKIGSAASFAEGLAAGGLQAIEGVNLAGGQTAAANYPWPLTLAGVRVLLNGNAVPLTYVSDRQINIYVPQDAALGSGTLTVVTPSGSRANAGVTVAALQPGIFPGAVVKAGTVDSASTVPVQPGDYLEIYCTGLGATRVTNGLATTTLTPTVFLGGIAVQPVFSGLTPGLEGLYQVDVQVPSGLAPGPQSLLLSIGSEHSNEVSITLK